MGQLTAITKILLCTGESSSMPRIQAGWSNVTAYISQKEYNENARERRRARTEICFIGPSQMSGTAKNEHATTALYVWNDVKLPHQEFASLE